MSRVLFVTQTHNVWGGMEQWVHHFSHWLETRGWDVEAALPRGRRHNDPDAYLRAHPHLAPIFLDVRDGTERARVESLSRAIVRTRPDIVIPIASAAVFAAMGRARSAGSQARLLVPIRSLQPGLFCNIADHIGLVDEVVAVSRLIESMIGELLPEERERIAYVRHGVRPAWRARELAGAVLRVGFVGRLEQSTKRIADLAAVAAELSRRGVAAEVHVYGSGPDEQELGGAPVVLHGTFEQDELYERVYPSLDVLMLFSPAEGSPNAVYEAMQHGVVPIVSRFMGQRAEGIVRHGETGIVFPVGDVAAAASAVETLAADRKEWSRLSEAARAEVRTDTDVRMHSDWERILETTLARPPKPVRPLDALASPGGRLDRLLPSWLASRIRRVLGREFVHADGWGEWPGSASASPRCIEHVLARLSELD
jgi:glycosyltransferase involved in cell wall biosynthesis